MGLEERENRRKSVVSAIISEPPVDATGETSDASEATKTEIIIAPKVKEETRSKRLNLALTPTVYIQAQKKCKKLGISLNECVNQFLSNWAES